MAVRPFHVISLDARSMPSSMRVQDRTSGLSAPLPLISQVRIFLGKIGRVFSNSSPCLYSADLAASAEYVC